MRLSSVEDLNSPPHPNEFSLFHMVVESNKMVLKTDDTRDERRGQKVDGKTDGRTGGGRA